MDSIAEHVLKERYYQPDESSWRDVAFRVANFVGNGKIEQGEFFDIINNCEFIPNSPCLMNAGTNMNQLSACFTIPVHDSIVSIFDAVKNAALIHKSGGGTGFNFSELRGNGSTVKGTGHVASGPVSFMRVFNSATETIKQGGKRRGANMGALDVDHPDIIEFIKCKEKEGEFANFNISVNITDKFMTERHNGKNKEIWDLIVHGSWLNGEPGIIFLDNSERDNACPHLGKLKYRNPCQEFVGLENESCNLGSINLIKCYDPVTGEFDYTKFESLIRQGVKFLNNVVDKNEFPVKDIEIATKKTRKIGLGVMGYADLLIMLGLRYGSNEANEFTHDLFRFMDLISTNESIKLAEQDGTYPESRGDNRRNASVLSIAPTGSISLFAGVSSGIEPNFAYVVNRSTWSSGEKVTFKQVHPLFDEHVKLYYADMYDHIIDWMFNYGTISNCPHVNNKTKDVFVTCKDVTPIQHVDVQAIIQNHVDQSISKTINCPNDTTEEDIENIIVHAWKLGCKGLTIYREGSRDDVVLETNASKKDAVKESKVVEVTNPVKYKLSTANGRILPKTPRTMNATVNKRRTACGKLYIIPAEANHDLHSMFLINKGGGCDAMTQAIAELIGAMLRWGIPRWQITKICGGINCPACRNKRDIVDGKSCADIIASVVMDLYPELEIPPKHVEDAPSEPIKSTTKCPECGEGVVYESGCRTCKSCGWSKCG